MIDCDQILRFTQLQANKRKDRAYFYNDAETDIAIDEEFIKLWRNVPVEVSLGSMRSLLP